MKLSPIIILAFLPFNVFACWGAISEGITVKHETLIDQIKIIALGRLVKKEQQGSVKQLVKYHFQTVEILKGNIGKSFDAVLHETSGYTKHTSCNNHSDELFWERYIGRIGYTDDSCNRPIPKFIMGETYLIFFDSNDSKAYELISDRRNDKWYLFVKNHIKKTHNNTFRPAKKPRD